MYDPAVMTKNQIITDIYYSYGAQMQKVAYCVLKDKQNLEDAVQNALVSICRHVDLFYEKDDESIKKLINCIQKNEAIKINNKSSKHFHLDINDYCELLSDEDLGNNLINKLMWDEIKKAVSSLSDDNKTVFIMRYFDEISVPEIASLLNVSTDTVYKRIERSKKQLQKKLSEKEVL